MDLVIVESPHKSVTISKILGSGYKVLASAGHIRKINDSGAYKTGIDCKNNFAIDYAFDKSKASNIKEIKEAAKTANKIYVASDNDREGHGIAEEICEILKSYKSKLIRITFEEITKKAIDNAIKNPSGFDKNMASAAESRAVLDKLIGYRTSNLVLSKIGAPSAGRVQSALLRLLADKEEQIQKFKSKDYYEVYFDFKKGKSKLTAKLCQIKTKKTDHLATEKEAKEIVDNCVSKDFVVSDIVEKKKLIEPKLPLTTSAMQQLASNVISWAPSKTQKTAQTLYEKGYITYLRTDAVRFAPEFVEEAKKYIEKNYKGLYRGLNIPEDKNKNAQNAHESIRPTDIKNTPAIVSGILEADESKLYKLIYNYSLASLFKPATVKDTDVIIKNGDYLFKISGRQVVEESFLQLTNDSSDAKDIPAFKKDEKLTPSTIDHDKEVYFVKKETQPPQRYSEAGLVKLMEQSGIGRPSTFSPTIETLKKRKYIEIEKKAVHVTDLGMKLNALLKKYFDSTFDPTYTAEMETKLDTISNGTETELKFLTNFWNEFEPVVLKAAREINKDKPKPEIIEGKVCPKCGKQLLYRTTRTGDRKFVACSGFPKCKFTAASIDELNGENSKNEGLRYFKDNDIQCPECGDGSLILRKNKKGEGFYGCNRYPNCKCTMSIEKFNVYKENLNKEADKFNDAS